VSKKACVLQRRDGCREGLQNSCLRIGNPGTMRTCSQFALQLTARQYGEVVLPDDSTGQGPGTPRERGQKFVTVQGGYGALFAVRVQIILSVGAIAVQI